MSTTESSRALRVALSLMSWFLICSALGAETIPIECGDVLDGRIFASEGEIHQFTIKMGAGDIIEVSIKPAGKFLRFKARIRDSIGTEIHDSRADDQLEFETKALASSGRYRIDILNRGIGEYDLKIGCKLRDGTVIAPESAQDGQ